MKLRKPILEAWKREISFLRRTNKKTIDLVTRHSIKKYEGEGILSHFTVQPSKYAQKMHSVPNPVPNSQLTARVKFERGVSLFELSRGKSKEWLQEHKHEIITEMANGLAEMHLKYGISHGDPHVGNIIARESKKGKVLIKFIDFEYGGRIEYNNGVKGDMEIIMNSLDTLSKDKKEKQYLWNLFKEQYEKKANEIL